MPGRPSEHRTCWAQAGPGVDRLMQGHSPSLRDDTQQMPTSRPPSPADSTWAWQMFKAPTAVRNARAGTDVAGGPDALPPGPSPSPGPAGGWRREKFAKISPGPRRVEHHTGNPRGRDRHTEGLKAGSQRHVGSTAAQWLMDNLLPPLSLETKFQVFKKGRNSLKGFGEELGPCFLIDWGQRYLGS